MFRLSLKGEGSFLFFSITLLLRSTSWRLNSRLIKAGFTVKKFQYLLTLEKLKKLNGSVKGTKVYRQKSQLFQGLKSICRTTFFFIGWKQNDSRTKRKNNQRQFNNLTFISIFLVCEKICTYSLYWSMILCVIQSETDTVKCVHCKRTAHCTCSIRLVNNEQKFAFVVKKSF